MKLLINDLNQEFAELLNASSMFDSCFLASYDRCSKTLTTPPSDAERALGLALHACS